MPGGGRRPSSWSADGKYVWFTNTTSNAIELWVLETATAKAQKIQGITLNAAYGNPVQWMPDQKTLLVQTVPEGRGGAPVERVPKGPSIQENTGKKAPVWTFEDLLKNPQDEALFTYYATAQLGTADAISGKFTAVGKPAIFATADPSPDGNMILVARVHTPYSYIVTHDVFPKDVEVWDMTGNVAYTVAKLPLQEQVQNNGAPVGPREYEWRPTEPATLVWAEALDEGNPRAKVPFRDKVMTISTPFKDQPKEVLKTQYRFRNLTHAEKDGQALLTEYDRLTRMLRTWLISFSGGEAKKVWERSDNDHYADPGAPMMHVLPNGESVIAQNGSSIFMLGPGGGPDGDHPTLDQFDLKTMQSKRLYRSPDKAYETVVALLSDDGSSFVSRYESTTEPPNYLLHSKNDKKALTRFTDPAPVVRKIKKQLVTYKRPDGVDLSFELYLPPDYKEGTKLPAFMWAYPREFTDTKTASQVTGSPNRFTTIDGMSELFPVLAGYAVLENAAVPVVGDAETVNNTYVDQIVASAKAAIDKADEMGVVDRNKVGVGGHSYGAFMTANLLTNCDLFKAGIARSGAYNRTLTPFGFQQELRTFWEAPEMYLKVSPFAHVDRINTPILLIHGEADNNSGTFPIQSERYYHALKGNGKIVRYVTLPLESHGYQARESLQHVLYEMINWLDRWVKNPGNAAQ
jgi:dipeptidyl aminopeptidase/acylaminoacyl peptidase